MSSSSNLRRYPIQNAKPETWGTLSGGILPDSSTIGCVSLHSTSPNSASPDSAAVIRSISSIPSIDITNSSSSSTDNTHGNPNSNISETAITPNSATVGPRILQQHCPTLFAYKNPVESSSQVLVAPGPETDLLVDANVMNKSFTCDNDSNDKYNGVILNSNGVKIGVNNYVQFCNSSDDYKIVYENVNSKNITNENKINKRLKTGCGQLKCTDNNDYFTDQTAHCASTNVNTNSETQHKKSDSKSEMVKTKLSKVADTAEVGTGVNSKKYGLRPRSSLYNGQRKRCLSDEEDDEGNCDSSAVPWSPVVPPRAPGRPRASGVTGRTTPKKRPLTKHRRKTANARERQRMQQINSAFASLRRALPAVAARHEDTQVTKITTLKLAVRYIRALAQILQSDTAQTGTAHISESNTTPQMSKDKDTLGDLQDLIICESFHLDYFDNSQPSTESYTVLLAQDNVVPYVPSRS